MTKMVVTKVVVTKMVVFIIRFSSFYLLGNKSKLKLLDFRTGGMILEYRR